MVTEKSLNMTVLHGEQDPANKIPYLKWARQIESFIVCKGADGAELFKKRLPHRPFRSACIVIRLLENIAAAPYLPLATH